jgi:hypothetical protein
MFIESSSRSLCEGSLMFVVDEVLEDNLPRLTPLFQSSRIVSAKA